MQTALAAAIREVRPAKGNPETFTGRDGRKALGFKSHGDRNGISAPDINQLDYISVEVGRNSRKAFKEFNDPLATVF